MAKLSFNKLGLKPNNEIKTIEFNGQIIEVKQYLPLEEKIQIITNVLQLSYDENNFANPVKVQVYTALGIIENYTNITFTDKQKENLPKLYDVLSGNGIIEQIIAFIPQTEYDILIQGVYDTIDAFYNYRNSVLGIINILKEDYSNLDFDASAIQAKLADPESLELLKGIMTQLG